MAAAPSPASAGSIDLGLRGSTVVVTGAGSGIGGATAFRHFPLPEWDVAGFDEHVTTNVRAPYFLIQAALPSLRESSVRSVVNISSSSGTLRLSGQSVYGMTKSAPDYLTQSSFMTGAVIPPDGGQVIPHA